VKRKDLKSISNVEVLTQRKVKLAMFLKSKVIAVEKKNPKNFLDDLVKMINVVVEVYLYLRSNTNNGIKQINQHLQVLTKTPGKAHSSK